MRVSITAKVFGAFMAVVVVFGITSAHSVWQLRRLQRNVRLVQDGHLRAMLALTGMAGDLKGFDRVLDEKDPIFLEKMLTVARSLYPSPASMRRHAQEVQRAAADNMAPHLPAEEREFLAQIAHDAELLDRGLSRLADGADELLISVVQKEFDRVEERQAALRDLSGRLQVRVWRMTGTVQEAVGNAATWAEEEEQRAIWATILLTGVALLVSLGVTWTAGSAVRPVRRLTEAVKRISAGGDMGRVEVETSDEVGVLASEFNRMVESLKDRDLALRRSERLATVGRMAAQVAHEVRNPLMSIGLNAELLEEEVGDGAEARALLGAVQREVERLTEVTENYLTLARLPDPDLSPGRVDEVLRDLLEFQGAELSRAGISVRYDADAGLPQVRADTNQLRQAFMNLVRNAVEAMQGGGELSVHAGLDGGHVEVRIGDTGPGVPEDDRERIFDPLHSTKPDGTGLGLAITRQIVETHGGRVACEARSGGGTVFRVQLPVAPT